MSATKPSRVTVLGLGAMGAALADAFLAAGHATTVWNRTAARADPLVARGALRAATIEEAVAASPLVVVCVLDDRAAEEVLASAGAALAGRVLVNLTTCTPEQARSMAERVREHGVDYLDGGIMAVPSGIATPAAFVLYSGAGDAFAAHREVLQALGAGHYLGTDPGLASLHDLALLSGMYGMFAGVLHAFALVRSGTMSATQFAPMLRQWLVAMGAALPDMAAQVDSGDHTTGVVSSLAMQAAGFGTLIDASRQQGVRPDLMVPIGALLHRAVAAGHGDADLSSTVDLLAIDDSDADLRGVDR